MSLHVLTNDHPNSAGSASCCGFYSFERVSRINICEFGHSSSLPPANQGQDCHLNLRLHTQVKNVLGQMEQCYDKLAGNLSQATVAPDSIDEILAIF